MTKRRKCKGCGRRRVLYSMEDLQEGIEHAAEYCLECVDDVIELEYKKWKNKVKLKGDTHG